MRLTRRLDDYQLNMIETDVPATLDEALRSQSSKEWKKPIEEELTALNENHTWDIVPVPPDKTLISSKWVFRAKRDQTGMICRYKARLCAKGFNQKQGIDYEEIFSLTARYDTIRVLLYCSQR